jgi:hypothetical protein
MGDKGVFWKRTLTVVFCPLLLSGCALRYANSIGQRIEKTSGYERLTATEHELIVFHRVSVSTGIESLDSDVPRWSRAHLDELVWRPLSSYRRPGYHWLPEDSLLIQDTPRPQVSSPPFQDVPLYDLSSLPTTDSLPLTELRREALIISFLRSKLQKYGMVAFRESRMGACSWHAAMARLLATPQLCTC